MTSYRAKSKKAEKLGEKVSVQTIVFEFNGRSPMLVHEPCYNDKLTQGNVTGIIQTKKEGGAHSNKSDHPSNFFYQCKCCDKKFPYK